MDPSLLNNYLSKLGLEAAVLNLELIEAMQRAHIAQFSFNSISPLLEESMPLDIESLYEKIVAQGRGGYCFEHNKLFFEVLRELGFKVRLILARVLLSGDNPPLTHRITLLEFDGVEYLVDVGFGAQCPRAPIQITSDKPSEQNGFLYRVTEIKQGEFILQTSQDTDYNPLYSFELNRYSDIDCKLGHFYSHKHSDAIFVNNLVVSRITDECVFSLRNTGLRKFNADSFSDTQINSPEQLKEILTEVFDIHTSTAESRILFNKAQLAAELIPKMQ